jgi:23S rRNA (adenine2503-C2)-methyltransferase
MIVRILSKFGREDIAVVYLGETSKGNLVEFVEALQPPLSLAEKWVLIVSTLKGCPVRCKMCDAGGYYEGTLSEEEIMEQIEYMIRQRFPDGKVASKKFKVQFARVGEPAFNKDVLIVLERLKNYENLIPCVSTIAPVGCDSFFEQMLKIKDEHYKGRFQLQFSIHSTDEEQRDQIMPVRKWSLDQIAEFGEEFVRKGDRKITLNFAVSEESILDARRLVETFSKEKFLVKITPINPTYSALHNNIKSDVDTSTGMPIKHRRFVEELQSAGFEVILSVGNLEENKIASNCGMYVRRHMSERFKNPHSYTYVS